MAINRWRGDAQAKRQEETYVISDAEVGDTFTFTCNRKDVSYTVDQDDIDEQTVTMNASQVAMKLLAAEITSEASNIPEFDEITATIDYEDDEVTPAAIRLKGPEDGTPFTVTTSTGDAGNLGVTITETVKGDAGNNEIQQVLISGTATGGTFTLTFDGQTTGVIAYNAAASAVETALEALSNIDDVTVTGSAGGPWDVEFKGLYLNTDVALMTGDGSSITKASSGYSVDVSTTRNAVAGVNEQQTVTIPSGVTGGTFTLTYSGQTTGTIAYNAAASAVETALEALSNIDAVAVTGSSGGPWVVEFQGTLAATDVALMTADGSSLVSSNNTVSVATDQQGGPFSLGDENEFTIGGARAVAIDGAYAVIGFPAGSGGGIARVYLRTGQTWALQQTIQITGTGADGSEFGTSVAIDGDTIAVGAPKHGYDASDTNYVANTGAVFVYTRSGTTWSLEQKVIATGTNARIAADAFGTSVSIDVDTLAVGAPQQDYDASGASLSSGAGAVFVFTRSATVWTLQQKLVATGTNSRQAGDAFGEAVAVEADKCVVGCPGQEYDAAGANSISNAGAAYEWSRTGSTWTQDNKIVATGTNARVAGDEFGSSIDLSGTTTVVGAPHQDYDASGLNSVTDAGAVYVFVSATLEQKLVATGTNSRVASDRFGTSVAVQGDNCIVGTPYQDYDGDGANSVGDAGAAFLFNRVTTTWTQSERRTATGIGLGRISGQNYGLAVAMSASEAVVGSYLVSSGRFYLYSVNSGNEQQIVTINGNASAGTFTLTWDAGSGDETTSAIARTASASTVQTALEGLTTPTTGDFIVTGSAGGPWTVEFTGSYDDTDVNEMSGNGANLTGENLTISETRAAVTPVDEQQTVTINGDPLGGTFTLTWDPGGGGETTGNIAYNASAATVETALGALTTPDVDDFTVTGDDGGPWVVTFEGDYAGTNVNEMTGSAALLSGTQIFVSTTQTATDPVDEQQTVTLTGGPDGGTFTLTYSGQTTSAIVYNATANLVKVQLEALSTIDVGEVAVTGSDGGPWTVTFQNDLGSADIAAMTGDGSSLTATGTQAFAKTVIQSPTGPNWYSEAENWSQNAVPVTDDTIVFANSEVSVLYGLDQSTISPDSILIEASFTGSIGLPETNATEYIEYRDRYLSIGADGTGASDLMTVEIGKGDGSGSGLIRLDTNDKKTLLEVFATGSSTEGEMSSVDWKGTHAENVVRARQGSVGIASGAYGDAATVATLWVSYRDSVESDVSVVVGESVTLTDVFKVGGFLRSGSGFTTLENHAGDVLLQGTGNVIDITSSGGTIFSQTSGTLGRTGTITGITAANPAVVTSASHGLSSGDKIRIASVVGMTEVNQREFTVEVVNANSFQLIGEDASAYTAYSSGGTWGKLGSILLDGDAVLDFTRQILTRQVTAPIYCYGDDVEVIDPEDRITTSTYLTGEFAIQWFNTTRFGELFGVTGRMVWTAN